MWFGLSIWRGGWRVFWYGTFCDSGQKNTWQTDRWCVILPELWKWRLTLHVATIWWARLTCHCCSLVSELLYLLHDAFHAILYNIWREVFILTLDHGHFTCHFALTWHFTFHYVHFALHCFTLRVVNMTSEWHFRMTCHMSFYTAWKASSCFCNRRPPSPQVMGLLMKGHKTEMDGSLAQKLVSAQLKGAWSPHPPPSAIDILETLVAATPRSPQHYTCGSSLNPLETSRRKKMTI